jgi:serine/threonine protein kinase
VVVKRPSERPASRHYLSSLEREYELTRALDGVAGVRQALAQESVDDQPALILEYIEGETLRDVVERNPLDLRSRLQIAVELAGILQRIHERRVIHLGISSQNILVADKQRAVHVIDLGAAFRIEGSGEIRVGPDQILATLPYISPEQTGRINRAVDERSDPAV